MDERSPLVTYKLSVSTEEGGRNVRSRGSGQGSGARKLSTFLGVVVPTLLAMFSVVLFLRIGKFPPAYLLMFSLLLILQCCTPPQLHAVRKSLHDVFY